MRIKQFILIMLAAMPMASGLAADDAQLLRDDFVISGEDGRLVEGKEGNWLFEFESAISDGITELKAGQSLELLASATLEKLIEDAKTRVEADYRLWGKVTRSGGRNFIFPVYFLGLRKIDKPGDQNRTSDRNKAAASINESNDIVSIPEEIAALLKTSAVLPAQQIQDATLQLKQDTIFANRLGRIVEKKGQYVFVPDALGRGIEKFEIALLPCQNLEDAIDEIRSEPNPVRFNVAGIMTRYKGKQYLLLQKTTRAYSYGNFGR